MLPDHYPQFFTATILQWKKLLVQDKYKQRIVDSLQFLVASRRVKVYGFVIMINHIHIVWQIQPEHERQEVQRDFLKYTAQQIITDLKFLHPAVLLHFKVQAKDRRYQIWERNALSTDLWSREVMWQKLQYIHQNPVRAGACQWPEDYYWSSAKFYTTGVDDFGWLTYCMD